MAASVTEILAYLPSVALALFLNAADIYFLQSERVPPFHKSPSFWVYLVGHVLVALFGAWLLYEKADMPLSDWPIVALITSLAGFSLIQSLTLKFGHKGLDARELFDSWKRRVIEDVSKANASEKLVKQAEVAEQLAANVSVESLEAAIHQLAPSVQIAASDIIDDAKKSAINPSIVMAQWIASADLPYAESLLRRSARLGNANP